MVASLLSVAPSGIPEPFLRAESTAGKFFLMFFAVAFFAAVFGLVLFLASLLKGKRGEQGQGMLFAAPAVLLLAVGLLYPAVLTIIQSLRGKSGDGAFSFENYSAMFSQPELLTVLRNTALWVILVPFLATAIGLLYAILIDRARGEAFAKALIFLPMAISMVGASIIWKFVYQYKQTERPQIGLLNQLFKLVGLETQQFLLEAPLNTLMLIIVMVWIQAGFAMTVLSAAIKAIPDDIIEAARLDGVSGFRMFRYITLPSIRAAVVVVLTTIGIGTLKVFDIVRTMTGGQFDTSVVANEFYNQSFRYNAPGLGAALAVLLFVLVIPIVAYNIVQMRKEA
ncbi:carbohydrate ABC transporter permease [Knoellia subterranea]|uniref:ABC transporter permease n=1 Tax=Knoellia subterranea KCTC 19937 TaxID=1385521 RepID=A0A0A0JSE6_9MICO|nr:sugar ABC transporter permease [Knoellia subterranea]KGN38511.1 ABC transporter permease [Knoellia subterranea KCTC 19937]